MAGPQQPSLQPTCEDYHSDDSDRDVVVEENFPRASPAPSGQANVAAKRSQNSVGSERPRTAEKAYSTIDVQSDSGYSSHTAATMSSADSAPSAKSQSPPAPALSAQPMPPPSPALKKRPGLGDEQRKRSSQTSQSQSSPRKPLVQRSGSVSSRNTQQRERRSTVSETVDCTDPNCTKCVPKPRGRRPQPSSIDSTLNVPRIPSDQRSQRSDPAPSRSSYISPQSPTYTRQPQPYVQGPAVIQPAQSTRRRSSSTARARPQSYAGGEIPSNYWVPGLPAPAQSPYPSPPQEHHGPPPAGSAYYNMHQPQMSPYPYGSTPPTNSYYPGHPAQTPPHEPQRPAMHTRNSSNFSARRPTSQYGGPLITQGGAEALPSARYPSAPQSARVESFPRAQLGWHEDDDEDDEEGESSEEYTSSSDEEERDRRLMPPPKLKSTSTTAQRRPSLRRPKTDYVSDRADRRMSQSMTMEPPRERVRDPRASQISTAATSRSTSRARPTLIQQPKAQSAREPRSNARVTVEDPRAARRRSAQIYDSDDRPRPRVYQEEPMAMPSQRRRNTETERPRRSEPNGQRVKDNVDDVEAYLSRTRGSEAPLNDQIHKAAKRASRVPSGPSDAGSSRSKGSDHKSRVSQSARTTVTNATNTGEIRLKIDASAPLSLQFNGDMEGRNLTINPAEDGMAEIVIASNRAETTYASERGSITGNRRSIVGGGARRGAEESSVRSENSSRVRRERVLEQDRVPLRRRADHIRYNS